MHTSGQWLEQEFLLPLVKKDPQAGGSCITYARRYGLAAMAGIPQVDDDAESAMLRGSNLSETVNVTQASELKKLLELTGTDTKKFLQHYKANSVDEMLAIKYSQALAALQSKVK
jgi:hypothetical protein